MKKAFSFNTSEFLLHKNVIVSFLPSVFVPFYLFCFFFPQKNGIEHFIYFCSIAEKTMADYTRFYLNYVTMNPSKSMKDIIVIFLVAGRV